MPHGHIMTNPKGKKATVPAFKNENERHPPLAPPLRYDIHSSNFHKGLKRNYFRFYVPDPLVWGVASIGPHYNRGLLFQRALNYSFLNSSNNFGLAKHNLLEGNDQVVGKPELGPFLQHQVLDPCTLPFVESKQSKQPVLVNGSKEKKVSTTSCLTTEY
ncbi:hypothetical protein GOBAR_AA31940 [Gossypium barbadense]|uniref:Uncharacterized protein n=1 Tax=Gossypium barbadense TaxID=3634 RepID=A0A2P5WCD6_GOSBA|nr:hypothetical protein GOBAR_AA31940 [Gossypium barbadense]